MAECVINRLGNGKYKGYSAGSQPQRQSPPLRNDLLRQLNYDTAPALEVVGRVCRARRARARFRVHGLRRRSQRNMPHLARPADERPLGCARSVRGRRAGERASLRLRRHARMLYQRIGIFTNLPLASLDRLSLQTRLDDIGRTRPAAGDDEVSGPTLAQRCAAECFGHGVPAGDGRRLGHHGRAPADGNEAIALLGNTLPTGAMLVVLITMLGPHFGRAFQSGGDAGLLLRREIAGRDALGYIVAQARRRHDRRAGRACHVRPAALQVSDQGADRRGAGLFGGRGDLRPCRYHPADVARQAAAVATSVGLYITAAYWFTASTSFANPAVTIARALTDTFAGIRPARCTGFIAAQLIGRGWPCWLRRRSAAAAWMPRRRTPHRRNGHDHTIYHNPACGTSRNTLAMIRKAARSPSVIEYLKTPPSGERCAADRAPWASRCASCCAKRARPMTSWAWTTRNGPTSNCSTSCRPPDPHQPPHRGHAARHPLCRPSEAVLDILPAPHRAPSPRKTASS